MTNNKFKKGDEVMVIDEGLMILQQFAPKGTRPSSAGWVEEIMSDGMILIKFPIGDDDPDQHSQVAPYPESKVVKNNWTKTYPIKK